MDTAVAIDLLKKLGVDSPDDCIKSLDDGHTSLIPTASGATLALLRRGDTYDSLLVGSQATGSIFPLRAVLEDAFLPMSDNYASKVGVAHQQRDAIRKRIREAAVALDVIASGRMVSVPPPDFPTHAQLRNHIEGGAATVDQLPEAFINDLSSLNQLQANVLAWSKEVDRVVQISRKGPGGVLTAEEEMVFWSSLDAALSSAESFIVSSIVKMTINILARKRRATGFIIETSHTLSNARRNCTAVLTLVQGLPLVALRSAESLPALKEAVVNVLEHIANKIRGSAFSVNRSLSLIHAMGDDVTRSMSHILSGRSNLLSIPYGDVQAIIGQCCDLFEAWSRGFDTCRQVVRKAARARGEAVPPRSRTQISRLYLHLNEIYELRTDQHSLRSLLTDLLKESHSPERIDMVDAAYSALLESSRTIDHFKMSEKEESDWLEAIRAYRAQVKKVEDMVCADYIDIVERAMTLEALAHAVGPFTAVIEKTFMSTCVEEAMPFVLRVASKELKILIGRERLMNSRDVKRISDGMLGICIVLSESLQLCKRAAAIVKHIETVLGKEVTRAMADVNDFILVVKQMETRAQPVPRFTEWLGTVPTKIPDHPLFRVAEDPNRGKRIVVNLDVQIAYFSTVHAMKVIFPEALFSRKHTDLSRFSSKIHPVFSDLQQSLRCYDMVVQHLQSMDASTRERLFPFVCSLLDEGETILEKGFSLRWDSDILELSTFSSDVLKHCSLLYNRYHHVIENDNGIDSAIGKLDELTPTFENHELSSDLLISLKEDIFDQVSGHRKAFLELFSRSDITDYFKSYWQTRLCRLLSNLLSRTINSLFMSLHGSNITQLQIALSVQRPNDEAQLLCVPTIKSAEQFLLNSIGKIYTSFREIVRRGYASLEESEEDSRRMLLDLLHGGEHSNKLDSKSIGVNPFKRIACELDRIEKVAKQWAPFVQYFPGSSGTTLHSKQASVDNDGNESSFSVLSHLSEVFSSVVSLQKSSESSKLKHNFIFLDTTGLSKKILANLKDIIRDRTERCGAESARLSQSLYKEISGAKQVIKQLPSSDVLRVVICLQGFRDDVLPSCQKSLEELIAREKVLGNVISNILHSSPQVTRSMESWVRSTDLKPHLESLKVQYDSRSEYSMKDRSLLLEKHEELRKMYQARISGIFSDFQTIRGKDCVDETYLDLEDLIDDLEHQIEGLEDQALNLERLAKALDIDSNVDRNGPRSILNELKRLRESLERLGAVTKDLDALGATSFGKADMSEVEDSLKKSQKDVEQITLQTGSNREALKISNQLTKKLQQIPLLRALHSIELSAPRERDVLKRLFGNSDHKEALHQTSLKALWEVNVSSQQDYLKGVFEVAGGEALISDFLRDVERKWSARKCQFLNHDDVPLLQGISDILDELDEHIQAVETMKASSHAKLFETERLAWEKRLSLAHEKLELMADVQSRWAHLKTLFSSRGSSSASFSPLGELHEEISSFSNVHARFASVGVLLSNAPGIIEGLETDLGLEEMQEELKGIVRGLSSFLEKQRSQFPRFFFLSDDDLLHVLSVSTSNLEGLQPHVSKLFPGLAKLSFESTEGSVEIVSVESSEGEILVFSHPVAVSEKPIVGWLQDVQKAVCCALRETLKTCHEKVSTLYGDASHISDLSMVQFRGSPVQTSILALRISFTEHVELCLQNDSSKTLDLKGIETCIERNLSTVCSVLECPEKMGVSSRVFMMLRDQLIKEFVYQRDLVIRLQSEELSLGGTHVWQNELRFYMHANVSLANDLDVTVKCACASSSYGWEYLGIGESLVRTSLTSKCFLILSEATRRGYGGSPFGPAGTGKTETVKALGKAMGRFVSLFNCDESFDSVSVGRILAGACRIGCWVCFDEFNRLSSSSLSSTSGQLAALQDAVKRNESEIPNFYGGELSVKVTQGFAIFVTMNPSYTGRRELPANLKSLFRPCAMSKPDTQPIAEVLLLSENFKFSAILSKKLLTLFSALRSTLSEQPHYDFGLRSMKSTILACGSILSSMHKKENVSATLGDEEDVLVRGIGEVLKPKLDSNDVSDYERLVDATFSEASSTRSILPPDLEKAVNETVQELNLVRDDVFMEKVRQLYSLLRHHCGVMMVGETGTGKSTVWRVLYDSLKLVALKTKSNNSKTTKSSIIVIDAKLLSAKQLYGSLDNVTREWTDGIFTKVLRTISEERSTSPEQAPLNWIVFDGDVDPDWIETLNSVLDDNRILTLPNGEQIPFLSNTRIIFETDHLRHANPSSVSRCGMICFGDQSFVLPSFTSKMVNAINDASPSYDIPKSMGELCQLLFKYAGSTTSEDALVKEVSLHSLLDSLVVLFRNTLKLLLQGKDNNSFSPKPSAKPPTDLQLTNDLIIKGILSCGVKIIGSGLTNSRRSELSKQLVMEATRLPEVENSFQGIANLCLADVSLLSNGEFVEFAEILERNEENHSHREIASPDVVIPTPTTVRLENLLRDILNLSSKTVNSSSPLILCGPPGCGKSMILMSALREIPNVALATLSFSSETTPTNVLTCLKGHAVISKRSNGSFVLQPKSAGFRVILFCDEVNLEKPDQYETQTSVSLLRSLTQHCGFWTGSPPYWVSIEGIQIVAACNPADDAGRHRLSPRFLRHCLVVRVEEPTTNDLQIIYGTFNAALLRRLDQGLVANVERLTSAMVEFFARNKTKFSPPSIGPLEAHYIYSPRDLSRWTRGMSMLLSGMESSQFTNSSEQENDALWVDVIRAFCYEARRLFRDRLVREVDQQFVETQLLQVVRSFMNTKLQVVPEFLYTSWMETEPLSDSDERRFQVVKTSQDFRSMIYEKLRIFSEEQGLGGTWIGGGGEGQAEDNNTVDQFAVTDDVLTHLTRIERILCQPLGHAVLMGASGTGKKTLARFAAWMLSIEVHQVRSHSSYTEQEFAKDLREILRRASINNRQMLMIFDESHAMETAFLEMMNSLLACGEVPGLFTGDERARLLDDLRQVSSQISSTEQALYSEFVRRIRTNLHIIFTISLDSPHARDTSNRSNTLSDLSRRSPALYNRCTVDWIGDWSRETLAAVAELKLDVLSQTESQLERISRCAVEIHEVANDFVGGTGTVAAVTPRHYLEFIEQFNRIVLEKGGAIEKGVYRYKQGVQQLRAAGEAVEELKDQLGSKAESLRVKEGYANEMLQKMVEEQRCAEKSKVDAEQLAAAAEEASQEARVREDEVAVQLSEVLPKIEAAREAVGMIRKENLEELRAMPNPPEPVRLALEAVIMLLDGAGTSTPSRRNSLPWGSIRGRMRSSDFIPSVVSFDASSLSKSMRTRVKNRVINNPAFDVKKIAYASRAAGPLAEWTLAIMDFLYVKDCVEPLQKEVEDLQAQQTEYIQRQEGALDEAFSFKQRIEECRAEYARLVSEAERIRQDISESETNLSKAERMLDSLGEEWSRWIRDMKALNTCAESVWGDSVFAAAFIAYAGPLDYVNRRKLCSSWRDIIVRNGIQFDNSLSISEYLTTPEQRGIWATTGLPIDASSLENYAILRRSARFPVIIDPTRGCSELLRYVLKAPQTQPNELLSSAPTPTNQSPTSSSPTGSVSSKPDELRIAVSSFSALGKKSYIRALESAVRFGTVIILEDAERYDRVVTPLLGQEVFFGDNEKQDHTSRRGTSKFTKNVCQRVIRLGDRDVFLNSSFRMYLAAADLERIPRAAITRANVVSFELSAAALGSTCVSRSLKILAPEVERRRAESLAARVEYEHRKRFLEEKVLSTVNNVDDVGTNLLSGSLLQDLTSLKEEVAIIDKRQKEEQFATQQINDQESRLEPLGKTAVDVFSVIQSLSSLNSIYRFNTEFFLNLFDSAIHRCVSSVQHRSNAEGPRENNPTSVSLIACQRALLQHTLAHVVASLFPRDQLAFAAALVLTAFREGMKNEDEWKETERIRHVRSAYVESLSRLERKMKGQQVNSTSASISRLPIDIKEELESSNTSLSMDGNKLWKTSIDVLERSLNKPELISTAVENLACVIPECRRILQGNHSGSEDALRGALNSFFVTRKNPVTGERMRFRPLLLCVRGDTCDPAALAMEYANDTKLTVMSLAMGRSIDDSTISNTIVTANRKCDEGRRVVVLIKNMHLASKTALNRIHGEVSRGKGALPCLLIVVVEINSEFSKNIVMSLSSFFHVLAFESPPSFRTNFAMAVDKVNTQKLKLGGADGTKDSALTQKLQVLTSWLHASILERKLHCPIGFTKEYDFSDGDLSAAWDVLHGLVLHGHQPSGSSASLAQVNAVSHMLSTCVYGSRLENEHDQEITRALVQELFTTERLGDGQASSNEQLCLSSFANGQPLNVPIQYDSLLNYIQSMPVHAEAQWCHMPADTATVAQTKDGVQVLTKLIRLTTDKFSKQEGGKHDERGGGDEDVPADIHQDRDASQLDALLKHIMDIPNIMDGLDEKLQSKESTESALSRFFHSEQQKVGKLVQDLQSDVGQLLSSSPVTNTKGKAKAAEINKLRFELDELYRNGTRQVPHRWRSTAVLFGGESMSTSELFNRVEECVSSLKSSLSLPSVPTTIDLRAIVRPQGLLTALRYQYAQRHKISPHRLHPVAVAAGERETHGHDFILSGLRLDGADWNSDEQVFYVSQSASAPCTIDKFIFAWVTDPDECEPTASNRKLRDSKGPEGVENTADYVRQLGQDATRNDLVRVNIHGRGRQTSPLWNIYLISHRRDDVSPWQWRLNGVSMYLR